MLLLFAFLNIIKPSTVETILGSDTKQLIDSMHSFTDIHESRDLKQARPYGQYVDLLRYALATPSRVLFSSLEIITYFISIVNPQIPFHVS